MGYYRVKSHQVRPDAAAALIRFFCWPPLKILGPPLDEKACISMPRPHMGSMDPKLPIKCRDVSWLFPPISNSKSFSQSDRPEPPPPPLYARYPIVACAREQRYLAYNPPPLSQHFGFCSKASHGQYGPKM